MNILGIIPARGCSKGIPEKNLRKIDKKPLIQYTIETAKKSKINKLIVSTDDQKIVDLSKSLKVDVSFLRPKSLSQDNTPTINVIKHTLKFLSKNNYYPDIVVVLQPTSPFRTVQIINDSIDMLQKTSATSILSVSKNKHTPFTAFSYKSTYLKPFVKKFEKYNRRQLHPTLYYPNGVIYTFWVNTLSKYDSLYGPRIKPLILDEKQSIDIDNVYDVFMTEMTMLHWKKYLILFEKKSKNILDNR